MTLLFWRILKKNYESSIVAISLITQVYIYIGIFVIKHFLRLKYPVDQILNFLKVINALYQLTSLKIWISNGNLQFNGKFK